MVHLTEFYKLPIAIHYKDPSATSVANNYDTGFASKQPLCPVAYAGREKGGSFRPQTFWTFFKMIYFVFTVLYTNFVLYLFFCFIL